MVRGQHSQEEGADDAAGYAGDDDLCRADQARDEDATESSGDKGCIVEDVEQVCILGGHLEGSTEGVGICVALEKAFQAAGHDVVNVDKQ